MAQAAESGDAKTRRGTVPDQVLTGGAGVQKGADSAHRGDAEHTIGRPSTGEILAYLCVTGVLGTADMAALEEFARAVTRIYMPAGATLTRQGERADALYVIVHGSVQAATTRAEGSALIVNEIGPGEVVGELPLMTGGAHTETLHARGPVTLLACPYPACRLLWARVPAVLTALTALARGRLQRSQLIGALAELFGTLDGATLSDIAA